MFAYFDDVTSDESEVSTYHYEPVNWISPGTDGICNTYIFKREIAKTGKKVASVCTGSLVVQEKGTDSIAAFPVVVEAEVFNSAKDVSDPSNAAVSASSSEDDILLVDKNGIKVVITGVDEPDSYSTKIRLRIENLSRYDINVSTVDGKTVVNGKMMGSPLRADVKSGKTSFPAMEFSRNDLKDSGINKIQELAFAIKITDAEANDDLYTGDQVYYVITDDNEIRERVVLTDKDSILKVQKLLNEAGYDCGSPDGVAGTGTYCAMLEFERDYGLLESTDITSELISALESGDVSRDSQVSH